METAHAIVYFLFFVMGVIVGRISMAIQYAVMSASAERKRRL